MHVVCHDCAALRGGATIAPRDLSEKIPPDRAVRCRVPAPVASRKLGDGDGNAGDRAGAIEAPRRGSPPDLGRGDCGPSDAPSPARLLSPPPPRHKISRFPRHGATPFCAQTIPSTARLAVHSPRPTESVQGTREGSRSLDPSPGGRMKPGDEVFGGRDGAFAEYVTVREARAIALKPASVTFEQAASVPIAAITALQALRDKGHIHAGQKVLINGASGGVGTFAVQIAKSFGAEVTGVCSTKNVDMVRSLGADHVIDYTREDFTAGTQHYDLIIDNVATHSLLAYKRVLSPNGSYVMIGMTDPGNWFGWLAKPIEGMVLSKLVSQKFGMMLADLNHDDLAVLGDLMQSGKVTPVIERRYKLSEAGEALR